MSESELVGGAKRCEWHHVVDCRFCKAVSDVGALRSELEKVRTERDEALTRAESFKRQIEEQSDRFSGALDAARAAWQRQVDTVRAGEARLREALEGARTVLSLAVCGELTTREHVAEVESATRAALASDSGREWLERFRLMEKVVDAAKACQDKASYSRFSALADALAELDKPGVSPTETPPRSTPASTPADRGSEP